MIRRKKNTKLLHLPALIDGSQAFNILGYHCLHLKFIFLVISFLMTVLSPQLVSADNISASKKEELKHLLAPKEGENSSEESVKELFTKTENNYSLLKKGDFTATLDAEYSYYDSLTSLNLLIYGRFDIQEVILDSERALSTTVSLDYGITKNINLGLSVPFVVKDNEQEDLTASKAGDAQFSIRWQPRPSVVGEVTTLLYFAVVEPTGDSPYEIDPEEELATGRGVSSYTLGATFFRVFDPLVGFSSLSYTHNRDVDNIDQLKSFLLNDEVEPGLLNEIEMGDEISGTLGLSYAITYDFTLTLQYQHSISQRSTFFWQDVSLTRHKTKSATYDAALAKITVGWKGEEGNYFNFYVSRPLTQGQADIMVGVSMPLKY